MSMRLGLAVAAVLAASAGPAHAAVVRPKPILVATAPVPATQGPVLAGGKIAWSGQVDGGAAVYRATRGAREVDDLSRLGTDVYDLAASSSVVAFAGTDLDIEQRYDYEVRSYFFGKWTSGSARSTALSQCFTRQRCTYRYGGVEADGGYVAWGPYDDGTGRPDTDVVLIQSGNRVNRVVEVPGATEFKIAGRYLAYRLERGDDGDQIIVVDWVRGRELRDLTPGPTQGFSGSRNGFFFDIDSSGRVAVASATSLKRASFGLFDPKGRYHVFSRRSRAYLRTGIWVANGRIAYEWTDAAKRRRWEVTDLRGRPVASLPAKAGETLTDFDGSCLAWRSEDKLSLYVAATRPARRGSICR